ncbi:MAG: hypothetical protein ACI8Q9_002308, partial [Planctomycetota bacterium]
MSSSTEQPKTTGAPTMTQENDIPRGVLIVDLGTQYAQLIA